MKITKKRIELWLITFAVMAVLVAAAPPRYDIEIKIKEYKIENLSPQGLSLVFYLNLANSSSSAYLLAKYDYRVVVETVEYLRLETVLDEPIQIEPGGKTLISLPIKITYALLFRDFPGFENKDKLLCSLIGGMTFLDRKQRQKRIPIGFSGEFPVFRDFEIKIEPLEAKSLSIGGAELDFKVMFENHSGFELKLERLTYKLELRAKAIAEGEITEGKRMRSQEKQTFSIPLLLDFFEIGKDFYQSFEASQILVRFYGRVEVATEWGNFFIPFDKSEQISVIKTSNRAYHRASTSFLADPSYQVSRNSKRTNIFGRRTQA